VIDNNEDNLKHSCVACDLCTLGKLHFVLADSFVSLLLSEREQHAAAAARNITLAALYSIVVNPVRQSRAAAFTFLPVL